MNNQFIADNFLSLALLYLDEPRNVPIWDMWCLYRDCGMENIAKNDIRDFFKNRAQMLECVLEEEHFDELTESMWEILNY